MSYGLGLDATVRTRRSVSLPADCAEMIAKYGAHNVAPPGVPADKRARYSSCVATWRALNVRAGRDPMDGGTPTGTSATPVSS